MHLALHDSVESLEYWRRRRARLPWYRRSARREAARMILRWERRARAAALRQVDAPMCARAQAGAVVARSWLERWARRAAVACLLATALAAAMAGAAFALVLQAV